MEDLRNYNPEGSDLRRAQLRMLEIAKEFDQICKKNNITYWLMSGTLLGARRHGGFIPWDDDFDVGVKREDYNALLVCLERELTGNLKLQTRKTDSNYPLFFSKIRDLKSIVYENQASARKYKYNGLFIDIFPFESICLGKKWKLALDVRYCKLKYESRPGFIWKLISNFMFSVVSLIIPVLRLFGQFTNDKFSHGYGIGFYAPHKFSTCLPVSKIKFEDYEFNAPHNVDQYLIDEYGDFMTIPPKDKREFHATKIEFLE
ncbi:lipopolysaccharide cholinephosphotransferase [Flavobacterium araucananum]|uniref:LicD/FKTN/FKRP nucleotidyltransferase domain-containing protein n=1 Tax=Flavobacterium araucananum TaxID=946678 RepID=A0A227PGT6_9FLAO|nr:LicD family protein [Flavobacterium araucananum]OXG08336.1 hypothetical protein B0A64_06130 [Flavobacterium araucananum]PWJ99133.1 lipopolysaccharide cholinephosphotransferase [Flavobacterium araucananum]